MHNKVGTYVVTVQKIHRDSAKLTLRIEARIAYLVWGCV